MIFVDTESCGLTGPTILIQYAEDDGPVILHDVFLNPISTTLKLIERMMDDTICGFNLTHDHFHFTMCYNVLSNMPNRNKHPKISDLVNAYKQRPRSYCLRPRQALDLFLHSRKGPWQSLMERKDVTIKRVPYELADPLARVLTTKLKLPWIYFARGRDGYTWKVEIDPDEPQFANLVLRFKASGALKTLATEIFKTETYEIGIPKERYPPENLSNPYATGWEPYLQWTIEHWQRTNPRSYAEQDVILLQRLWHHFGEPLPGDYDSELACCIGGGRWRGYSIDLRAISKRLSIQKEITEASEVNVNSHIDVRQHLRSVASPEESICIPNTKAETLELLTTFDSPLGIEAKKIVGVRKAYKEIDVLQKLLDAERYCPTFKIIGTRSGRMAGGGGGKGSINPQGIKRTKEYRSLFILKDEGFELSGGDFEGFEVSIADAAYKDVNLRHDLQTGKSFHGLFGTVLYDLPYEQIMASKGGETDYYSPSKSSAFGVFYGAKPQKIATVAGITEEAAEQGYAKFIETYPGVGKAREVVFDAFCSMRQPGGIGTEIIWRDPPEYIASLLGYRRYFTLENSIVRCLFELGQNPPEKLDAPGICRRRDKDQTKRGALRSSLFSCAFQLQAYNMRAAANHVIQATGAELTKKLQCQLWHLQPSGISEWQVMPMNQHDEIVVVHVPELRDKIKELVSEFISRSKNVIPLIKMDWKCELNNWGDLK